MIARLAIATPFVMVVPSNTSFRLYPYEDEDCRITVRPPARSDVPFRDDVPDAIKINDATAHAANALVIEFQREYFQRAQAATIDPSIELLARAVSSFVTRLRYVTRGSMVHPVTFQNTNWRLQYLNDDGTELPETTGLRRAIVGRSKAYSYAGLDDNIWENIHALPPTWSAPPWDDILLDATAALPMLGPAVVLAATALEVFIATTLDSVSRQSNVQKGLWEWINNRGNWLRDPSVGERFDVLLHQLTGHSLMENPDLWQAFQNLRGARNSFVHEGHVSVGKAKLDEEATMRLIEKASEIITWIRQWIPSNLQWPTFDIKTTIEVQFSLP